METLLNNLIKAMGWSILHSIWQGALIYALLLPSQMSIFKLKAKTKYALAYGANCLMLLSFIFTFISVFHWPAAEDMAAGYHPGMPAELYAAKISLSQYAEMAFPILVLFYAFGLLIQAYLVFKGYKKVQALKNAVHTNVSEEWFALFIKLTNKLKIKKHIVFKLSAHVQVPLVVGYMKPVILFPLALALQMDIRQVKAILIHELSHVRRDDYLLNLVKTMIDTILFFNPFVWLTGRFISIEREHACDDLVIALTKTPLTYAHALLKLELLAANKSAPTLALAATGNNQQLYQRIKRITDMKTNYMNSKQKLFAVTLTIATIISLAWINPSKIEKRNKTIQKHGNKIEKLLFLTSPIDTAKKKPKKIIMVNGIRYEPAKDTKIIDTAIGITQVYLNNIKGINGALNIRLDTLSGQAINQINDLSAVEVVNKLMFKSIADQKEYVSSEALVKFQKYALSMSDTGKYHVNKELYKAYAIVPGQTLEGVAVQQRLTAKQKEQAKKTIEKLSLEIKAAQLASIQARPYKVKVDGVMIQDRLSIKQNEQINKIMVPAEPDDAAIKINGQTITSGNTKVVMGGKNIVIYSENGDVTKLKQTPEYMELKKKFDKDVEDLVNKKLKKNK